MAPVFEPIEDFPDRVNYIVEDDNLPGSTLGVKRGWRVEELELFLEGGLARLSLTEEQELHRRCAESVRKGHFAEDCGWVLTLTSCFERLNRSLSLLISSSMRSEMRFASISLSSRACFS